MTESKSAKEITIDTKELLMTVLMDKEQRYSVSGYNERAKHIFGEIYLGLDKGPEYDRQANQVNSAIQSLSAADAFARSIASAREKLKRDPSASDNDVFVSVLADMCTYWFDIPDAQFIFEGGPEMPPVSPARCPGHYNVPSACMFYADGDKRFLETGIAPKFGQVLREGHDKHIAKLRSNNAEPCGELSRKIFNSFSNGEDDLISRTTIGVMMGMLPTVYFNLVAIAIAWRDNDGKIFNELKEVLAGRNGNDPYARAYAVLSKPMSTAIQKKPMPPQVWRTATEDHDLGCHHVKAGDKIIVDIETVTNEDHKRGTVDLFPVFGGDRSKKEHPTHACPGYEAAIAMMLGALNGLMEPEARH